MEQDALGHNTLARNDSGGLRYTRQTYGLRTGLIPVAAGPLNEVWNYTYDAVGNITGIAQPTGSAIYGYDLLDRVTSDTPVGSSAITYSYDAVGNRTSENEAGVTLLHTYGATSNRQITQAGVSLGYDATGNRTSDNGYSYTYNTRNRLYPVHRRGLPGPPGCRARITTSRVITGVCTGFPAAQPGDTGRRGRQTTPVNLGHSKG